MVSRLQNQVSQYSLIDVRPHAQTRLSLDSRSFARVMFWGAFYVVGRKTDYVDGFGFSWTNPRHYSERSKRGSFDLDPSLPAELAFSGTTRRWRVGNCFNEFSDQFAGWLERHPGDEAFMVEGFGRLLEAVKAAEEAALANKPEVKKPVVYRWGRRRSTPKARKFKISIDPRQESMGIFKVDLSMNDSGNLDIHVESNLVGRVFHTSGDAIFKKKKNHDGLVDFLTKLNDDQSGAYINHVFKNVCRCVFCGRSITDAKSQAQGSGDICYRRYGGAWKKAAFKPLLSLQTAIRSTTLVKSSSTESTLPTILMKASPVLLMMLEDEDEDAAGEVLGFVQKQFSPNDITRLSEFVLRFCLRVDSKGKQYLEGDSYKTRSSGGWFVIQEGEEPIPYRFHPDKKVAAKRRQELIDAILEAVGIDLALRRTPRLSHSRCALRSLVRQGAPTEQNLQERNAFIWTHMVTESMVRLVHYLDMEYVLDRMRPFLKVFRAELMWNEHVDGSGSKPKPVKPDVDAPSEVQLADPNAPKKPRSAYHFFCDSFGYREKWGIEELAPVGTPYNKRSQFVRTHIANLWKDMSAEDRKRFDDQAEADKLRYAKEMKAYTPPDWATMPVVNVLEAKEAKKAKSSSAKLEESSSTPAKKAKDPDAPKRGMSAFLFFSNAKRAEVTAELKAANPDLKGVAEVGKRLGEMWKELSDEAKQPYNEQAAADKERYEREQAAYNEKKE